MVTLHLLFFRFGHLFCCLVFFGGVRCFFKFCCYCGPYKRSETSYRLFPSLPSSWFVYKTCYFTIPKTHFQTETCLLFLHTFHWNVIWFVMLNFKMVTCNTRFLFKLSVILHEVSCLHSEALMRLLSSGCHSLKILSTVKFISRILDECAGVGRWGVMLFIRKGFSLRK